MNNKAFNISFDEEKDFYPKDCKVDTSLDNDIMDFFKSQKNEEDKYYLSKKIKNKKKEEEISNNFEEFESKEQKLKKQNKILNNKEENDDGEDEIEENIENEDEESSSSSELIYSTFPDNIELSKKNVYEKMNINKKLIEAVIEEYSKTKNKFLNEYKKEENENLLENDKFIINHKEFNKYDLPDDNLINNKIIPFKSNEYLMKNINKCFKVLKNCNKSNKKELGKVSEWFYTFFLFLEMPLSPDFNADLYSINKYIYNNFMKISELKIIFIIICEIFKQILIV